MSSTNQPRVAIKVFVFFIVFGVSYCTLALGDYLIVKFSIGSYENPPAKLIESKRVTTEDKPQRAKAIAEGFQPAFFPAFLDEPNSNLRVLAEKHLVAPLAPQPNANVYYCNEGYGLLKFRTDRFGFRNKDTVWTRSADIVLIGDSFTHGACVEGDQTIGGILETSWNVVNLASGGNNPIHYAAVAKTFLEKIKPKYAAIVFYANDNHQVFDNLQDSYFYNYYFVENRSYFSEKNEFVPNPNLGRFYEEAVGLMQRDIDLEAGKSHASFFERGPLWQRATNYLSLQNIRGLVSRITINLNSLDSASKLAIDVLATECQKLSCKPLIIYIPNSEFWRPDARARRYEDELAKYALKLGVPFWSASEEFSGIPNSDAYAPKGPHLSPLGNATVAKGIEGLLSSR